MFSYTDSVFHTTSSPTKELKIESLQHPPLGDQQQPQQQQQLSTNSYLSNNHSNNGPLYPYNDMLYSIDNQQQQQQQQSSYDNLSHHHYQQQHQQESNQHRWHQEPPPQQQNSHSNTTSNSFYSDIRNPSQQQYVMEHPSFDHYNAVSPFSSPVPNNNVLMGNHSTPTSQRSSLQSLPSVPPIPSSSNNPTMLQQPHHHHQQPSPQHQTQQQQHQQQQQQRPRITTSLWDDEGTVCYQVDVRGICVARRQDNDMVNGTKLLNVTGMSRGKRDGILKNEKGRVVVKVGAMHLKGVWVTFARAKALAVQFNIADHLHPLFVDEPAMYFYSNQLTPHNYFIPNHPIYLQSQDSFTNNNTTSSSNHNTIQQQQQQQHRTSPSNSSTTASINNMIHNDNTSSNENYSMHNSTSAPSLLSFSSMFPNNNSSHNTLPYTSASSSTTPVSQGLYHLPSAPPVPSMMQSQMSMYAYNNTTSPYHNGASHTTATTSAPTTTSNPSPGGMDMHFT